MLQDSALIYDERSLLAHTSPALAGQVVEHVHAQALRKVPFFADASNECCKPRHSPATSPPPCRGRV